MQTIHDVDFAQLYLNHFALSCRKPKTAEDWDSKAEKMFATDFDRTNDYVQAFVSKMDLKGCGSMLDVGCGGGAISLVVADQLKQVYVLDYSPKMLKVVEKRAEKLSLKNIHTINKAWEDDWSNVPEVDICVSSRSSMVPDLADALALLNSKARKAVYMTMMVDKDFIVRDVLSYIGRDSVDFPSYIYAVNMLYQQGYRVKVDFITSGCGDARQRAHQTSDGLQDFIKTVQWSIGKLSDLEIEKLIEYYVQHQDVISARPQEITWAFLNWEK